MNSQEQFQLSQAQLELLDECNPVDAPSRAESLQWLHDAVIYGDTGCIENQQKAMLYNIKRLIDIIKKIN